MILAYLPEETEAVIHILRLQLCAQFARVVPCQVGNGLVLLLLELPHVLVLRIFLSLILLSELILAINVVSLERNDRTLTHENDILFINRWRWILLDLLKEAIYDVERDNGKHFLDEVVDGANDLFVLA